MNGYLANSFNNNERLSSYNWKSDKIWSCSTLTKMSLNKILRHFLILPFRFSRSTTRIIFEICPSAYSCEQKGVTGFQTLFLFWVHTNQDSPKLHQSVILFAQKCQCYYTLSDQSIPLVTITSLFYVLRTSVWVHIMIQRVWTAKS